jgi:hypothetical protein
MSDFVNLVCKVFLTVPGHQKSKIRGGRCSSVVERLSRIHEALGLAL